MFIDVKLRPAIFALCKIDQFATPNGNLNAMHGREVILIQNILL